MPIWKPLDTTEQPEICLIQWRVLTLPNGDRHFNGYVTENREGRVSSPILAFDPVTMCGKTRSGRIYQLVGDPGFNMDADYVLNRWLRIFEVARSSIIFLTLDEVTETPKTDTIA